MTPGSLVPGPVRRAQCGRFCYSEGQASQDSWGRGSGRNELSFCALGCVFTSNELANLTLKANFRCD